jgi:hypothetical protein
MEDPTGQSYRVIVHRASCDLAYRHETVSLLVCVGIHPVWCICRALPVIQVTVEASMLRYFMNRVVRSLGIVGAHMGSCSGRCSHVDNRHSACLRPTVRMTDHGPGCYVLS